MIFCAFKKQTECDAHYGNICYLVGPERMPWTMASAHCMSVGANLLDLDDDGEMNIIINIGKAVFTFAL